MTKTHREVGLVPQGLTFTLITIRWGAHTLPLPLGKLRARFIYGGHGCRQVLARERDFFTLSLR